jgi:hypothetical protein
VSEKFICNIKEIFIDRWGYLLLIKTSSAGPGTKNNHDWMLQGDDFSPFCGHLLQIVLPVSAKSKVEVIWNQFEEAALACRKKVELFIRLQQTGERLKKYRLSN